MFFFKLINIRIIILSLFQKSENTNLIENIFSVQFIFYKLQPFSIYFHI